MSFLGDVRRAIYAALMQTGRVPAAAQLAAMLGLDERIVAGAYRDLAEAHVIVLAPGTLDVAWAPPFSAIPTRFRSTVGSSSWYAPCAWDAFGIPAALRRDAVIEARCAWSGQPIASGVEKGRAYGDGVIHLLVPAARFWDDIGFT